jgi:hypothetical protein
MVAGLAAARARNMPLFDIVLSTRASLTIRTR